MLPLLVALSLQSSITAPVTAAAPVHVLMVVPPSGDLPAPLDGVQAEVARIWRSTGVEFTWARRLPGGDLPVDRIITVRVDSAEVGEGSMPLGALGGVPSVAGRLRQVIYVSPSAIRQLVSAAGVLPHHGHFPAFYARTVGRVVAHELGHLLLDSSGHRKSGLMRQSFGPRDVVSGDLAQFLPATAEIARIHDSVASARREGDSPRAPLISANRTVRRR